uniref:Uncharacterized protein n=1 Tax=Oryza sativa subsp. japonica TaxID=39947 RepID=Q60DU6_ORYSJ|nr:hypothetical protein [Oryza sativa Japonica Group]
MSPLALRLFFAKQFFKILLPVPPILIVVKPWRVNRQLRVCSEVKSSIKLHAAKSGKMLIPQLQSPKQQMQRQCLHQQVQAQMQAGIRIRAKVSLFSKSKHLQPQTVRHQVFSRLAQLSHHQSQRQQVLPIVVMVYKVDDTEVGPEAC